MSFLSKPGENSEDEDFTLISRGEEESLRLGYISAKYVQDNPIIQLI